MVRTRFAPSPTGNLHLGGARTCIFNWLFARRNGGKFILRIEDTDLERSTKESADNLIKSLKWLGIDWDEGPYYQSDRLGIYNDYIQKLKSGGFIYPAFDSKEELERMREDLRARKLNPIYDRRALKLTKLDIEEKLDKGETFIWRFKVSDDRVLQIPELLMGKNKCKIKANSIGDFVITRPGTKDMPGQPLYNFVCAIDDALMEITHVLRGVEHLNNAAVQMMLYDALGFKIPKFVHMPLILRNGKKMSKRDLDVNNNFPVSVEERRELGYCPEGTFNYLALLGWTPADEKELLSVDEMIDQFDIDKLSKSNANFDEDKYLYVNAHYLRKIDSASLVDQVIPYLTDANYNLDLYSKHSLANMILLEQERCRTLKAYAAALDYYFIEPTEYEARPAKKFLFTDVGVSVLELSINLFGSYSSINSDNVTKVLAEVGEKLQLKIGKFGPILRLALTGRMQSPSLGDILPILDIKLIISRLENALICVKQFLENSNKSI